MALESNAEWIEWGRRDPLYAVSTWKGKQKGEPGAWTEEEFYRLGESDWADFERHWKRYGYGGDSCLEIGCGAGRLTRQIARTFARVEAVDVSADQIAVARRNVPDPRVRFHVTEGIATPLDDASVSDCFTAHVFQHLDSRDALARYLAEIGRVLRADGTLMAHLPIYVLPYDGRKAGRLLGRIVEWRRRADLRRDRRRRRRGQPVMRHSPYEAQWLITAMQSVGFADVEIASFAVRSNGAYHWFVLGRKQAPAPAPAGQ